LALNSEAAEYFEPAANSWRARILSQPLLLVAGLIVFVPNGLAGALNFQYNQKSISLNYPEEIYPDFLNIFGYISFAINLIAFPLGIALLFLINRPLRRAMVQARDLLPATEVGLDAAWNLGHRAAMIGGLMWAVSGIVFPLALRIAEPRFSINSAIEFFLSLVICGGFAWIYPFFGISLVATKIYYPSLVAPTMTDPKLASRADRTVRRATNYLATAAAIPLLALGLLALLALQGDIEAGSAVQGNAEAGNRAFLGAIAPFLLAIVPLTTIALPFAFLAHQRILESCKALKSVLA